MSNTAGFAALEAQIRRLRALPKTLVAGSTPEIAGELEGQISANVARGVGPDGVAWAPTKDGRPALAGAMKSVSVRAVGTVVTAELVGVEAKHHYGRVRGKVARPILPSAGLPQPMAAAIGRVVSRRFTAAMGGA